MRDWSALGQGGRPPGDGSRLWLTAAAALIVALAQPRWGRSEGPPLPPGHDVVIAVDVSRSMAARDVVPDRLGVAVESAESLIASIGREEGDRVAIVAFAGRGVLRCPLTRNLGAAVEMLKALRPGSVRPGGTDLGAGLDAALDAFDDLDHSGGRSVIVFSDGEDHAGSWTTAAGRLRAQGVVVHAVAVGDARVGQPIPSEPGKASVPIRYRGEVVFSRRLDESLASIARLTGGAFVPLGLATADMGRLYQTRIEPLARVARQNGMTPELAERFPWFLGAALSLVLAASWPRLALRRVAYGALAVALAGAVPGDDPSGAVAEGRAAYAAGRFEDALGSFRHALALAPENAVASYNVAATLFQLHREQDARSLYLLARARADGALRTKIDYALGNTALALGDLAAAIRHYDDCLASTAVGADLDRVRRDAAVNRRFVEEQARRAPPDAGPRQGTDRPRTPSAASKAPGKDGNPSMPGEGSQGPDGNSPPGTRGAGGAGGTGPAPPLASSPEGQLSQALENVREARRRRIEETDAAVERDDRKDW